MQEASLSPAPGNRSGDEFDGEVAERLEAEVIRELSQLAPAVSLFHIGMEWLLIFAAAFLTWQFWHPLLYVLAIAFIGARQHALIILAHDAAHYRLTRNRALNDWLGEIALAWPFVLFTMQAYRRNHFPHHRHVNTDRDPDWQRKRTAEWEFPKTPARLAGLLLLDVIGVGFVKFIVTASKLPSEPQGSAGTSQRWFKLGRLAFLGGLATALTALDLWLMFLLFWIVPYVTWMQLCFHIRSIAEHFAIPERHGVYAETRTVIPTWFDRLFVLSKNVNYHLEHHLYPSVPFYRLPELHRRLMMLPGYRDQAHVTRGYFAVLRECAAQPPG